MKAPASKKLVWVVMAALSALLVLPQTAHAQEVDYMNTVTVAAGATVEVVADLASISFGVRESAQTAGEATRALGTSTQSVVDALRAAGVGQDDELVVSSVHLRRRTDRNGNLIEYVATSSIRVKTDDLEEMGQIIDAGVAGGADSLGGLRYDVKDRTAAVEQALNEAMQFARLKANALATAAGRTVGLALIISEYNSRPPRTVSVAGTRGGTGGGQAASDAASYVPVEPPTLDADARITVTFELI